MFKLFGKKESVANLFAPVNGKSIPIETLADEVFASKMMGNGIAFEFEDSTIYSPCDGVISMIASTKHAIGLKSNSGLEVLIHVGLDTVNLNGQGFDVEVKLEQKVKAGDKLLLLNRSVFEDNGIDLTTPMIVTNSKDFELEIVGVNTEVIAGKTVVIEKK